MDFSYLGVFSVFIIRCPSKKTGRLGGGGGRTKKSTGKTGAKDAEDTNVNLGVPGLARTNRKIRQVRAHRRRRRRYYTSGYLYRKYTSMFSMYTCIKYSAVVARYLPTNKRIRGASARFPDVFAGRKSGDSRRRHRVIVLKRKTCRARRIQSAVLRCRTAR